MTRIRRRAAGQARGQAPRPTMRATRPVPQLRRNRRSLSQRRGWAVTAGTKGAQVAGRQSMPRLTETRSCAVAAASAHLCGAVLNSGAMERSILVVGHPSGICNYKQVCETQLHRICRPLGAACPCVVPLRRQPLRLIAVCRSKRQLPVVISNLGCFWWACGAQAPQRSHLKRPPVMRKPGTDPALQRGRPWIDMVAMVVLLVLAVIIFFWRS